MPKFVSLKQRRRLLITTLPNVVMNDTVASSTLADVATTAAPEATVASVPASPDRSPENGEWAKLRSLWITMLRYSELIPNTVLAGQSWSHITGTFSNSRLRKPRLALLVSV